VIEKGFAPPLHTHTHTHTHTNTHQHTHTHTQKTGGNKGAALKYMNRGSLTAHTDVNRTLMVTHREARTYKTTQNNCCGYDFDDCYLSNVHAHQSTQSHEVQNSHPKSCSPFPWNIKPDIVSARYKRMELNTPQQFSCVIYNERAIVYLWDNVN